MQCPNCKAETKGIRINGKLFCTNCGEKIVVQETPTETSQEMPKDDRAQRKPYTVPQPKVITSEGEELTENERLSEAEQRVLNKIEIEAEKRELDALRAEKKILSLLEKNAKNSNTKKRKPKLTNKRIIKHERSRVEHHKKKEFIILPGEPNPKETPELEFPKEDQLETSKENLAASDEKEVKINLAQPIAETRYPLLDKEKISEMDKKGEAKQKIVANFLKETAPKPDLKKNKREKKRKTKRKSHAKLYIFIATIILIILGLIGIVLYVNLYAIKPERAAEKEQAVIFSYKKPSYLPAGYEISYKTTSGADFINYVYEYAPNPAKTLEIRISKTDLKTETLFEEKIKPLGKLYEMTTSDNIDFYYVESNKLYFVANNLLIEISSSENITREELERIAKGML